MTHNSLIGLVTTAALAATGAACSTIPTGRTGVEWTPTGGTMDRTLGEGFHLVSPFSRVYKIDLREQEREEMLDVLANNGLDIKLTGSILFQPIDGEAAKLVKETRAQSTTRRSSRPTYDPALGAWSGDAARRRSTRPKREQIEREIRDEVVQKMDGRHLRINAILIREVHLPDVVQSAIPDQAPGGAEST